MIRIETDSGWILVEHREHARLAGRFAAHWGNAEFAAPEPRADILVAVARHDDAWADRDRLPFLTRQGKPSAFSQELVGSYSAFEEIDLRDYLAVRGRAAACVAVDNPYAAVVISMHTVDLLTAQADLSGLGESDRARHAEFIRNQHRKQDELVGGLAGRPEYTLSAAPPQLLRAFEFLQACDSLSLTVCVRFPRTIALRHLHPTRGGTLVRIECLPLGGDTYRITPYPFDTSTLRLEVPCRAVSGKQFESEAALREAYSRAPVGNLAVTLVR